MSPADTASESPAPVVSVGVRTLIAAALIPTCAAMAARAGPSVVLPLGRTAYFVGETVPLALTGAPAGARVTLEAVHADGRALLHEGEAGSLLLDTSRLAPGDYALELDGAPTGVTLALTGTLRRSAGSLQDEVVPNAEPRMSREERKDAAVRARKVGEHRGRILRTLRETRLSACFSMAACEMGRNAALDVLARAGTMLFVNPDTRPTSFFPVGNDPGELDGMCQRMLLTYQANARYPNFAGFCFGWDTTGYQMEGRKGLIVYWGWGDKEQPLRRYIDRLDRSKAAEFTRRTGLEPITYGEYLTYLLSIGRPEFAPAIDLPTKLWLGEITRYVKPLPEAERAGLEVRLDEWSGYLMGLYRECYSRYAETLGRADPTLRFTASVQVDHAAVRHGQYFPSAYGPLDLLYQSTWNDQVGGPDYAYQWLFTAGLLNMQRRGPSPRRSGADTSEAAPARRGGFGRAGGRPIWLSNAFGGVHGRSAVPGKFVRVAAHGLAHGGSGVGFALEGFSNVLGGMNRHSSWDAIRGTPAGEGVLAGREFLDRFAALAVEGRGDHGVGVLFSKSQYARQHTAMGFGTAQYRLLVALTRLGYTPRFVTEEEIEAGGVRGVKALVVASQTVPLPWKVMAGIDAFVRRGGRVLADGGTIVRLPGAERLEVSLPFSQPGKPHNWAVPNIVKGDNDALMYERWHAELAPVLLRALGGTGRALFASAEGARAKVTLMQIDGGEDAKYLVAVNDSHVKTQADWHRVSERLVPTAAFEPGATVYDCTAEESLGPAAPFVCDLTMTTARVYAVLPREVKRIALSAAQNLTAGEDLAVSVEFLDRARGRLRAAIPFHVQVTRPDGEVLGKYYRSTSRDGAFSMGVPVPANAPAGRWRVSVRSELDGLVASVPVTVRAAERAAFATVLDGKVVARDTAGIEEALAELARSKRKLVLPLFETPRLAELRPAAAKVKETLAARGVEVEVRERPEMTTYLLSYDPTAAEREENARAERGETIGRVKRATVNRNDWYSGASGYRFGLPVVLLDLAGAPPAGGEKDNEMAEALGRLGALWPEVSDAFPGEGGAVVQLVRWAFGPRAPALVIQAADAEGLMAGASALAALPVDRLTPGIRRARAALLEQYHVGGRPAGAPADGLTSKGLRTRRDPQPFSIRFGDAVPPTAEEAEGPERHVHPAHAVPATLTPEQFVTYMRVGDNYVEAASPGKSWPRDLRFSQAILVVADVKRPGPTRIVAEGTFRYSDRRPKTQPQWENLLALRDRLVPRARLPMEIEVRIDGTEAGKLVPGETGEREVQVNTPPWHSREKPKTAREEVVLRLAGEVELPAGRHELLLVHRNIVDGSLEKLHVGGTEATRP